MWGKEGVDRVPSAPRFCLTLILMALFLFFFPLGTSSIQAQVTTIRPDSTLPTPTTVNQAGNVFNINGGTVRGPLQFHSFDTFSLGAGHTASFNGPSGITNILSRVTGIDTGLKPSLIDGAIQTTIPGANLFFMNPAGIVFGPNATLNVGGAVSFTTANYIRLFDGVNSANFYANPAYDTTTTAGRVSILSAAPLVDFGFVTPAAFGFLGADPAPITVRGSTFSVPVGQLLTLAGGNIAIASDPETGTPAMVTAPAGEIRLASVASPGEILLSNLQTGPNLNGQSFSTMGTVTLSDGAFLDVSDNAFEAGGIGGTIRIRGGQLIMESALVFSATQGDVNGATTAVDIQVTGDVSLDNYSAIASQTSGQGRAGEIIINAHNVEVAGASTIVAFADGDGRAGDISITASGSVSVHGTDGLGNFSNIESTTSGTTRVLRAGDGGSINIAAPLVSVEDQGIIRTRTSSEGQAGNMVLAVDNLDLRSGGVIESQAAGGGATGSISIAATGQVSITGVPGASPANQTQLNVRNTASGETGGLSVQARNLIITDEATIDTQNMATTQRLELAATDSLTITNGVKISHRNQTSDAGVGAAELSASNIIISGNVEISSSTIAQGNAGDLTLIGKNITVSDNSNILSRTINQSGNGGRLTIRADDSATVTSGSIISASALNPGTGSAGPIEITGSKVSLSGPGTKVLSETAAQGNGGPITIRANQVSITDGAVVSASSTGSGAAGTVTIEGTASPAESIVISGSGSGVFTTTSGTGAGGDMFLHANSVTLQNGGTLSAKTSGTAASATGGTIGITATDSVSLTGGASITASSTGPANAGNIAIDAGNSFFMQDSSVTTEAKQASGGDISVQATSLFRMINSKMTASVQQGSQTIGGNITIDPEFVILQNQSQILATAVEGTGGNILIVTPVFLADQTSVVDASSQFGRSGTVTIQSPTSQLAGTLATLPQSVRQAAALNTVRCAAQMGGQASSFVVAGRDTLPAEPGGWMMSALATASAGEALRARDEGERGLSGPGRTGTPSYQTDPIDQTDPPPILSLRRMTPGGFLTQMFAVDWTAGCGS